MLQVKGRVTTLQVKGARGEGACHNTSGKERVTSLQGKGKRGVCHLSIAIHLHLPDIFKHSAPTLLLSHSGYAH